ncbi:regulator of RNase E activity RraA [Caldalkalibacillus uzonensis]|uniref:Putative 4-hydroxy-4-methyl-2-oxoglutarate aldolase n=1 Tax=Caldalkalibacillus uzonensis TaxID=353224 RepID=A0ABU0CPF6_9BACI|nr:RraA family protein [Caldalkalibacillus uzonensis]MDQ0338304.1 regulator of RNase E activity RraA [Caldalkalibacillus uzonensis]
MKYDFGQLEQKVYTAVTADILDDLGLRAQVMEHHIRPIDPSFSVIGRAFTILATDVYEIPEHPYKKELEAVDALNEGDIVVATTNGSTSSGFWGELLSTAAMVKGSRGAIIDGFTRDSRKIIEMGFPTFTRGFHPHDSKGRTDVINYQVPIECGGVKVFPGDIIVADHDGIVVVPQTCAAQVFERVLKKVDGENAMRKALQQGMGIVEAYKKYNIL